MAEVTRGFVGREWLFRDVSSWLQSAEGEQFLLVTGEPGSGKTAFAAALVNRFAAMELGDINAAYHFCSVRDRRWVNPFRFSESLSEQLSAADSVFRDQRWRGLLPNVYINQTVERNFGTAVALHIETLTSQTAEDHFDRLVREPLHRVSELRTDPRSVLLIIDALDESLVYSGGTSIAELLAQTAGLPSSVRVVVTSRPDVRIQSLLRPVRARVRTISLSSAENAENGRSVSHHLQEDLRECVTRWSSESTSGSSIHGDLGTGRAALTEVLIRKSGLNFLYLRHLLRLVDESPSLMAGDILRSLPHSLDDVYSEHLTRIGDPRDSDLNLELMPILGVIAAARSPITENLICEFAGFPLEVTRRALSHLRPLLATADQMPPSVRTYAIYHNSLVDFLTDRDRNERYWIDPAKMHRLIASHYLRNYAHDWSLCDDYGLSNLAIHLYGSIDLDGLQDLADPGWFQARLTQPGGGYVGLADDALTAWRAVAEANRARLWLGTPIQDIHLEFRWALCCASLNSLVAVIGPEALGTQVASSEWTTSQALAAGIMVPEGAARSLYMASLGNVLPAPDNELAWDVAAANAALIADPRQRAATLTRLIGILPPDRRKAVIGPALEAIGLLSDRRRIAEGAAGHYGSERGPQYRQTDERKQAIDALVASVQRLAIPSHRDRLAAIIRKDGADHPETEVSAEVGRQLEAGKAGMGAAEPVAVGHVEATRASRTEIGDASLVARATARLAGHADTMPDPASSQAARELERIGGAGDAVFAAGLVDLMPALEGELASIALRSSTRIAPSRRNAAIIALAPRVASDEIVGVVTGKLGTGCWITATLSPLAPFLPDRLRRALLAELVASEDPVEKALGRVALAEVDLPVDSSANAAVRVTDEEVLTILSRDYGSYYRAESFDLTWLLGRISRNQASLVLRTIRALAHYPYSRDGLLLPSLLVLPLLKGSPEYWDALEFARQCLERDLESHISNWWFEPGGFAGQILDAAYQLQDPELGSLQRMVVERVLDRSLTIVHTGRHYQTWTDQLRIRGVIGILPHLREPALTRAAEAALYLLREVQTTPLDRRELSTIAWYLPTGLLAEARQVIAKDPIPKYLPKEQLPSAMRIAREARDTKWIMEIARRVEERDIDSLLASADEVGGGSLLAQVVAIFVSRSDELPLARLYEGWTCALRSLAKLDRATFLGESEALAAILLSLGGRAALDGAAAETDRMFRLLP